MFGKEEIEIDTSPRHLDVKDGLLQPRMVEGVPQLYISNLIKTSKYTKYNFLCVNLMEQLTRPANAYFIFIMIFQIIPAVSISQGRPTILLPLLVVLTVGAIKDAIEDKKRHQADREENERMFDVFRNSAATGQREWSRIMCQDIQVGDLVRIHDEEPFPADLMILTSSSEDGGYCYIETANLDGETNLKIRTIPDCVRHLESGNDHHLLQLKTVIDCDAPSGKLDIWGGTICNQDTECLLAADNLLLRGARLRNTGSIVGLVVYTGPESKIRMNSSDKATAKIKRSSIEYRMNKFILFMASMQAVVCFIGGINAGVWQSTHPDHTWYIKFTEPAALVGVIRFFTWFIIFAAFVPISLLVSMELVKFWQGMFMGWDMKMMHIVEGEQQFAQAQTSGLNEELGAVQYILSDKTGTLTCNSMDFRKSVIGGFQYGTGDTDISRAAKQRGSFSGASRMMIPDSHKSRVFCDGENEHAKHVLFNARQTLQAQMDPYLQYLSECEQDEKKSCRALTKEEELGKDIFVYLESLALGNTVFPTIDEDGESVLKASSPDEEALVEFARFMGVELYERNSPYVTLHVKRADGSGDQIVRTYEQLALLDFTSKRKRMSVILRCPDAKVRIYCKGADSFVDPLLEGACQDSKNAAANDLNLDSAKATLAAMEQKLNSRHKHRLFTMDCLDRFGEQGLRTLMVAVGTRDAEWWDGENGQGGWKEEHARRMKECAIEGPEEENHHKGGCQDECRRCALERDIELDSKLQLVGATAIEDKLQDNVPTTIKAMLDANMNVWVLTGDKLETAINIGMACSLLESSMERKNTLFRLTSVDAKELSQQMDDIWQQIQNKQASSSKDPLGLVVTSGAFATLIFNSALVQKFLDIATRCKSVIGCRMQPNQKARIVRLVKETQEVITLAIGDGANDELMIREANVGVGIRGVEGTAAVRAADYAISQFGFLRRLLLVHGRLSMYRISTLICYIFYKNAILCWTVFWFGIYSGFSGQPIYNTWAYQLYNIAYTGLPILFFAVLDRDVEMKDLFGNPRFYIPGQKGEFFNKWVFGRWMMTAFIQSMICFFIPVYALDKYSIDSSGQSHGIWTVGLVVYTCVVLTANLELGMCTRSWNWLHHLTIWGSIIAYFFTLVIFSSSTIFSNAGSDYYYVFFRMMGQPIVYFCVIITVCAALFIDFTIMVVEQLQIFPCLRQCCGRALGSSFAGKTADGRHIGSRRRLKRRRRKKAPAQSSSGSLHARPSSRRAESGPDDVALTLLDHKEGPSDQMTEDDVDHHIVDNLTSDTDDDNAEPELMPPSEPPKRRLGERRHTGFSFDYTPGEGGRLSKIASNPDNSTTAKLAKRRRSTVEQPSPPLEQKQ